MFHHIKMQSTEDMEFSIWDEPEQEVRGEVRSELTLIQPRTNIRQLLNQNEWLLNRKKMQQDRRLLKNTQIVLEERAERERAPIGKEGRVLIESECVRAGCWSEMGPGPSWLPLQRASPAS